MRGTTTFTLTFPLGLLLGVALVTGAARADDAAERQAGAPPPMAAVGEPAAPAPVVEHEGGALKIASPDTAAGLDAAIQARLAADTAGLAEPEIAERHALAEFYAARHGAPLWLDTAGAFNARAASARSALQSAADWGLQPAAFALPRQLDGSGPFASVEAQADAELSLSLAVLKYARHARGGRIPDPTADLSSYLDRKPQLIEPREVLARLSAATDVGAELTGFHPRHPEFERLRHALLATRGTKPGRAEASRSARGDNAEARRILANMEEWRWMPADMGEIYVEANIPEFMLRVYKDGRVIHSEKIVAGEIGKQTPIFTRPMKRIVFRPKWRVPESIKVRELWPDMLRGGSQMRSFGLQLETKDGEPLDWRSIDWTKTDIRNYEVVQPPGPKSVLGQVKFAFPSQHTVYMHDTPDKYMFAAHTRAFSHGCMRVRNPLLYAEVLLHEDKGWDGAQIRELATTGPLNNEIALDKRINVHITYFTARVGTDGRLKTFSDIYGHERRIAQALDGRWKEIAKGRDHLAPVALDLRAGVTRTTRGGAQLAAGVAPGVAPGKPAKGLFDAIFGGGF